MPDKDPNKTTKTTVVLFNPSSAKGRSLKKKDQIRQCLDAHGIHYDFMVTESEAHLRSLAAETARQYDIIVAVGWH